MFLVSSTPDATRYQAVTSEGFQTIDYSLHVANAMVEFDSQWGFLILIHQVGSDRVAETVTTL